MLLQPVICGEYFADNTRLIEYYKYYMRFISVFLLLFYDLIID